MPVYRLSRAADDDIDAIFFAGIEMFGVAHAETYYAGLSAALAFLADNPFAARLRREIEPPVRAWRHKAHLIVYEVDTDGILVLRVRHGREDWLGSGEE
ncbi:type II toxin-antitoxin system RelE/ParE family toxin [Polymorphobacter sp. PAMC 29334]|uniref:type II toxin-antitoxin system RelE/ParE family toxin n=1 Tax=Polymorphobacter sp. PAMC 29334 TaxID=2862331 RepID=UPI001C67983E|nr:type II toxin-antitoxin system RelE/ParE family toxin [Polymorphobacter sp. PAMC 29334]QYE35525.1 type II toxin-antitoxin system RelE/ParE family toxin [Polymorphobacter sp. PAMC 29334]